MFFSIFRLAADDKQIAEIKAGLNAGTFHERVGVDVNAIATMIKIWLRELPSPILGSLSIADLASCTSKQQYLGMFPLLNMRLAYGISGLIYIPVYTMNMNFIAMHAYELS